MPFRHAHAAALVALALLAALPQARGTPVMCEQVSEDEVRCDGRTYFHESLLKPGTSSFYMDLVLCGILVIVAGLMSGLTLGLLSVDLINLEVIMVTGTAKTRAQARRIMPLVRRHHLLLVTLLLANAAAMEALPIFLDRLVSPMLAIAVSVTLVLIFGEVLPQAACSRYGLAIGANTAWLVWIVMAVLFPIAWPISKALDWMLGEHHRTFFRRAELKALVKIHKDAPDDGLTFDEDQVIGHAIDLSGKSAQDVMTPLHSVYMMSLDGVMDHTALQELMDKGHSRVPVYDGERNNIVGMILTKSLIIIDPDDAVPVRNCRLLGIPVVDATTPLFDMINLFQQGKSHMALVKTEDMGNVGIITLEDCIEELIGEEILDETDEFVDVERRVRVSRLFNKLARGSLHIIEPSTPSNALGVGNTRDSVSSVSRGFSFSSQSSDKYARLGESSDHE